MKRALTIGLLALVLTSCGSDYMSKEDFEKETAKEERRAETEDSVKISYVDPDSSLKDVEDDDRLDLGDSYGTGKAGEGLTYDEAQGTVLDRAFGAKEVAVSLGPTSKGGEGYSVFLSYKREASLMEREFGPVFGEDGLLADFGLYELETAQGDYLLASLVSVDPYETYSAYYIFDGQMEVVDSFIFASGVDDTNTLVTKSDDTIISEGAYMEPGSLGEAINSRKAAEETYLEAWKTGFGLDFRPLSLDYGLIRLDLGREVDKADKLIGIRTSQKDGYAYDLVDISKGE